MYEELSELLLQKVQEQSLNISNKAPKMSKCDEILTVSVWVQYSNEKYKQNGGLFSIVKISECSAVPKSLSYKEFWISGNGRVPCQRND